MDRVVNAPREISEEVEKEAKEDSSPPKTEIKKESPSTDESKKIEPVKPAAKNESPSSSVKSKNEKVAPKDQGTFDFEGN